MAGDDESSATPPVAADRLGLGAISRALAERPTRRFIWASLLLVFATHLGLWVIAARQQALPLISAFARFDTGWYLSIVDRGYSGMAWAFYPLWPVLVAYVAALLPVSTPVTMVLLATALFLMCVALIFTDPKQVGRLAPETRLGWLVFLCWPASYVFHTGHTESLFMLLSLGAFALVARGAWIGAAVLAGLCALTRNQGVLVALTVGLWAAYDAPPRRRLPRLLAVGAISGALYGLYPLHQYLVTGDPFLSSKILADKTQTEWKVAQGWQDWVTTALLGNSRTLRYEGYRHPSFVLLLGACFFYLRERKPPILVGYFFLSLIVLLPQGSLTNLYRYTLVLAPLLFFLGDWFARRRAFWPIALLAWILFLHVRLTWRFPLGQWAY